MPFWLRNRLAKRWRDKAGGHIERSRSHRDEAYRLDALADWILPESTEDELPF